MPDSNGMLTTQERTDIAAWWQNYISSTTPLCPWDSHELSVDDHVYEMAGYPMTAAAAIGAGVEAMFAWECDFCGYHSYHSFDQVVAQNGIAEFRT